MSYKIHYLMLTSLCLLFFGYNSSSQVGKQDDQKTLLYQQNVHQYLVQQAFELLKFQFPAIEYSEMNHHIGTWETSEAWTDDKVVVGAYREDDDDAVYGVGGPFNGWTPTSTHFWDADAGDDSKIDISVSRTIENAYQKARVFTYGRDIWGNTKIYFIHQSYDVGLMQIILARIYSYESLFDFYRTGRCYSWGFIDLDGNFHWDNGHLLYMDINSARAFVWEILGRVAHLLGDMGVPAHTHNDEHPSGDAYEDWMTTTNAQKWNYLSASNAGGLIDVLTKDDPLRYLFYTLNQITDHFPSNDYDGDNNYNAIYKSDYYTELSSIITDLGDPPLLINVNQIANTSFVNAIRCIAGLFYWFATETEMLPVVTVKTSFNGGSLLVNAASVNSGYKRLFNNGDNVTFNIEDQDWTESNGRIYHRVFDKWKKENKQQTETIHNERLWLETITESATYTAIMNKQYNINISTSPTYIEGGSGGSVKRNGVVLTTPWYEIFTETKTPPMILEAIPPDDSWSDLVPIFWTTS
jgi:hypothetical protein